MTPQAERRALQIAIALGGLVPVSAGLAGVMLGPDMVGSLALPPVPRAVALDSHVRYLSGLLLGIGLAFWSFIPSIERRTAQARLLTAIVFLGGLARLWGALRMGLPSAPMTFGLVMELVVTPLLCVWQARVARSASP
ncbi:MAG: DUF4345 domain-containing protein [Alphaproteobacteria bacterium]|nr:DUF4345 domain-containing protein [Alphaproteobacteria bacterium]